MGLVNYNDFVNSGMCEGFTMDDEVYAHYCWLFKQPNANNILSEDKEEEMYRDIEMWLSLSSEERDRLIFNTKFTGFLKDDRDLTDDLIIYKGYNAKTLLDDIESHLIDYCANNGDYDAFGYDMYYVKYSGEKDIVYLNDYDFDNCEHLHYHTKGFKGFIDRQHISWIFDDSNYRYYISNKSAISEILSEMDRGLKYYYNGKRLK